MSMDPFYVDIPAVLCPHCGARYQRAADLEVHRERHRPIPSKLKGSSCCPKGCGRCLVPDAVETQTHLALCDGSPPINGIPRAMKRKWYCPEHDFGTDGPKPWGWHKQEFHGGQDPRRPVKRMPEEPVGEEAVTKAIGLLEVERERLMMENAKIQQEIQRLDAALKVLKGKQLTPVEA